MFKSIAAKIFKSPTTTTTQGDSQNLSTPNNNIEDKKRSTIFSALTIRKDRRTASQAINNTKFNNRSQVTLKNNDEGYVDPFSDLIEFSNKAHKNKVRQTNIAQKLYSLALGDLLNDKSEVKPWSNDNYSKIMENLSKKDRKFYFDKLKSLAPIIISHSASKDPDYQNHINKLKSKGIEIFIKPPEGFYDGLTADTDHKDEKEKTEIKTFKEPSAGFYNELISGIGHNDLENNSNYSDEMLANLKEQYNQNL
ncbi:MAG: hypothetical protein ON057_000159 [Glomeribacter sp. 1016415]|nr:hypothetical protein [Glomeribacter sp. 1016415]